MIITSADGGAGAAFLQEILKVSRSPERFKPLWRRKFEEARSTFVTGRKILQLLRRVTFTVAQHVKTDL